MCNVATVPEISLNLLGECDVKNGVEISDICATFIVVIARAKGSVGFNIVLPGRGALGSWLEIQSVPKN